MTAGDREDQPRGTAVDARAVRGVVLLVGRSVGIQTFTLAGTIALARLVTPSEYGLFAIALGVQQFGRSLSEFGLGPALVRRSANVTTREQRAVNGLVLLATSLTWLMLMTIAFAVLPALDLRSRAMEVVAVTSAAMPLYGLRIIPIVLLERQLSFGRLVVMEIAETLAFYAFAVPAAVAGWGAFALSGALPAAAMVGTATAWLLQPFAHGFAIDLAVVRPLAAFGLRVSAITPVQLARESALMVVLAAAGSEALAGFYNLAIRMLSLLTAISYSVQRVAFAALARVNSLEARERRAADAIAVTAVAASLPAAVFVGAAAPLIAVAFGNRWLPTADVLLVAGAGVLAASSLGAVLNSLALAEEGASLALRAALAYGAVTVTVGAALAGPLEEFGAGAAVTAGALAFCGVLTAGLGTRARATVPVVWRAGFAAAGGVVAARLASSGGDVADLATAVAAAGGAWLAISALLTRAELARLVRLCRRYARRTTTVQEIRAPDPGGAGS